MRRFPRTMKWVFFLLASVSSLLSQTEGAAAPTVFGDGLSLTIPAGWEITVSDTQSTAREGGMSPDETSPVTLLLHARAPGEGTASLTIVRDESWGAHGSGPMASQALLARLAELAAEKGYRADRPTTKGSTMTKDPVILGEIVGISAQGKRRVFACVSVSRFPGLFLRCYWQWDERDEAVRATFDDWLASANFRDQKIADLLAGKIPKDVAATTTPPKPDASGPPLAAATPTPMPKPSPTPTPATVAAVSVTGTLAPSASPSATPSPTPAVVSAEASDLVSKNQDCLIVVEGEKGRGSGFVCKLDGEQPYLVTNAHVLSDNPRPRFTTMNGATLTPGAAFLGVDCDIFKAVATPGTPMMEMMTEADGAVKIGDAIAVLGNAEGAGVVKAFEGRIVGLGPNLVEVDAPFVPGNSGSPIIHVPSGKVIGIATYLLVRKVDTNGKGQIETTVRRFGYRLDKVKTWEPLDWARFYAQSAQVDRIQATSEEFERLFDDAREKNMSSGAFTNPAIKRAVENLERSGRAGTRMSDSDRARLKRDFLGSLRIAAMLDVNAFDSRTAYDYFRREVADEKKFREDISAGLTRTINSTP